MIPWPTINRSLVVWGYRSLWLGAVLLALAMPLVILLRGDVWLGSLSFDAANRPNHSLIVIDGNVSLHEGIDYPLVVLFGDVQVDGPLPDALVVVGGDVYLGRNAIVEEAIVVLGGAVFREPGATIEGTIGATIHDWTNPPVPHRPLEHLDLVRQVQLGLAAGLALLLLCLVTAAALPWSVVITAATARQYPLRSLLGGLTGLLAVPFVALPLTLSLVGLPLAVALGLGAVLVWLIGLTSAGFLIGQLLLGQRPGRTSFLRVLIVGLAPILLATPIPVLGPLLVGAVGVVGAGARIVSFVERDRAVEVMEAVIRGED